MEDQTRFHLELAAYDEKIFLGKLEEAKASERVRELEYQKARFQMDWLKMIAKAQEQMQAPIQGQEQCRGI